MNIDPEIVEPALDSREVPDSWNDKLANVPLEHFLTWPVIITTRDMAFHGTVLKVTDDAVVLRMPKAGGLRIIPKFQIQKIIPNIPRS